MNNLGYKEINELNRKFYEKHNESFDKSRSYCFWEGFEEIIRFIPENAKVLDLGCGNARFLKFLLEKNIQIQSYLGLDNSNEFIKKNQEIYQSFDFKIQDVISELEDINSKFSLLVAFGLTHHIPGYEFRKVWFQALKNLIEVDGVLVLSFWNFDKNKSDSNYTPKNYEVEKGDYFLGWKDDFASHRFCHFFEEIEIKEIIKEFENFKLLSKFDKDMNTYIILKRTY